jgi:hypothetical protein
MSHWARVLGGKSFRFLVTMSWAPALIAAARTCLSAEPLREQRADHGTAEVAGKLEAGNETRSHAVDPPVCRARLSPGFRSASHSSQAPCSACSAARSGDSPTVVMFWKW